MRHAEALEFTKIALNAWESRAARGLLSSDAIRRITAGAGSTGLHATPLDNLRLNRKYLSSFERPDPDFPQQIRNSMLVNQPANIPKWNNAFHYFPTTSNKAGLSRFPTRSRSSNEDLTQFSNVVRGDPGLANSWSAEPAYFLDNQSKFFPGGSERARINANTRPILRHEVGHYVDYRRPDPQRVARMYSTINQMRKAEPSGIPGVLDTLYSSPEQDDGPTWLSEIAAQREATRSMNPRAKALIDETLRDYTSPRVEAMPTPSLKSVAAHLERNYQFPTGAPTREDREF